MSDINILLADDHRLFRQGLRQILELEGGFKIVGEAGDGQEAVNLAIQLIPDVVLMDINMPILGGVKATEAIIKSNPRIQVIILTMYRQDSLVFEAIKAGAKAYLLKDIDEGELINSIRAVYTGDAIIDSAMASRVLEEFRRLASSSPGKECQILTNGEMDVLRLVARGDDNRSIGKTLSISDRTAANRLNEIYQKLQVNNRTQAALVAIRRGWADLYE